MRTRTWAALTTAAGLALAPAAAQAATTITVTALGNDGAGSLRQAVTDAVDGDTIVLPEGTITLTGVLEILDKTLTIQGQGVAKSTITGNGTDRLLQLDDTVDADGDESDVITDVTLRGGRSTSTAGGAIGNAGGTTLTLRRVALLDNRAPIGGAADLAAPFHLEDVVAAGNVATGFDGGAFQVTFANGSTMDNVTITGNTAEGDGGAFDLSASASLTTLTITNSTIANNTITSDDNGAGFRAGSNNAVTLKNTVIAGNTEPSGVDNCATGGGASITSSGNNATDQTAATDLCNLVGTGDLRGVASPLVAMSDLGGPFDTMYLLPSGALIDGATTCSPTDGRGLPRAATCDIGAVERTAPSSTTGATDSVTKDTAHLTGIANGNGLPGKAYFEYGITTAYGTSTAQVPVASGAAAPVTATLTGLTPATSYHLRLVVQTTDGKVNGDDLTFTTLATPDPGGGGGGGSGGGGGGGGGGTTPTPGGGTTPPADKTAPTVTRLALKSAKLKAIANARALAVRCVLSEPGTCKVTITVDALTAKRLGLGKGRTLGTASTTNGVATIKLAKSRATKLGKLKKLVLRLRVVVADAAGNVATKTATLTAKR